MIMEQIVILTIMAITTSMSQVAHWLMFNLPSLLFMMEQIVVIQMDLLL
jgi:hypothetical protein